MRAVKGFFLTLFVLAVLGGAAFGVLAWRQAVDARSLDKIVIAPAPPQPPAPPEAPPLDPRLEGLMARADGARLLWAPDAGQHLLSAGFSDNGSLIVSATEAVGKTTHWSLLRLNVASSTPETVLDGTEARVAAANRSEQRNAGQLCYGKQPNGGVSDVWCSDLEGRGEKQLTRHDGKEDLVLPTISPDGAWVAFEVDGDRDPISGKPIGSTIWKIGLNGAGIQQLTRGADDRRPSWSDDGQDIYFQRRLPDGNWDLYAMQSDGTDPAPLLRTPDVDELFPVRRAAADEFLLIERSASATPRLKLLDDGTKSGTYLTDGASGPESSPSVSPDGKIASFLAPVDPAHPDALGI